MINANFGKEIEGEMFFVPVFCLFNFTLTLKNIDNTKLL